MRHAESVLKAPTTDWDDLYLRVKFSPVGADFNPSSFLRTPIASIRTILAKIDSEEQRVANIAAYTQANLTHLVVNVAHGFSGSKKAAPRIKPKDFLPFPDWEPTQSRAERIDAGTSFVLSQLVKQRRIPMHVFTALMSPPESDR